MRVEDRKKLRSTCNKRRKSSPSHKLILKIAERNSRDISRKRGGIVNMQIVGLHVPKKRGGKKERRENPD
jgi:hypothetical protein